MAYDKGGNKFRRKEAVGMELLVKEFIKDMKLSRGLNSQRAAAVKIEDFREMPWKDLLCLMVPAYRSMGRSATDLVLHLKKPM